MLVSSRSSPSNMACFSHDVVAYPADEVRVYRKAQVNCLNHHPLNNLKDNQGFVYLNNNVYNQQMNKQLERDLQNTVQGLKAAQLISVLTHYEKAECILSEKLFTKKGINFECEITFKSEKGKGYGRTEEEAQSNATKTLLSTLICNEGEINKIKEALKYKNSQCQKQPFRWGQASRVKESSFVLDEISMIQGGEQERALQDQCSCVFYELHKYKQNQAKHLQARINLLTDQNSMLKKLLLHNSHPSVLDNDKENSLIEANR